MKNLIREQYLGSKDKDNESLLESYMSIYEEKGEKPDFLDMDKDGDKEEPMKKAIKDKEDKENVNEQLNLNDSLLEQIIKNAEKSLQGQGGGMSDMYASYKQDDLIYAAERIADILGELFTDQEGDEGNYEYVSDALVNAML